MDRPYSPSQSILVAVDCILFGCTSEGLQVLIGKRDVEPEKGSWALMGGFVQDQESIDEAALRVLFRLTGISNIYLEQLSTFGEIHRDPYQRVISVAYFALINTEKVNVQKLGDYQARWVPVADCPPLIFDHGEMVQKAKERLKQQARYEPIGFALLPQKFTMPQLQKVYEAILETDLDRGNFSRRMKGLGILKRLDEKEKEGSKKGAYYYVFDQDEYESSLQEGFTQQFF